MFLGFDLPQLKIKSNKVQNVSSTWTVAHFFVLGTSRCHLFWSFSRQITGIIQIHKLRYPSWNNYSHHDHTGKGVADVIPTAYFQNKDQVVKTMTIRCWWSSNSINLFVYNPCIFCLWHSIENKHLSPKHFHSYHPI